MELSETTTRILVAAVGIPVVIAVIYLGGWPLALTVAAIAGVSATEFYRLAEKRGVQPLKGVGVLIAVAFALAAAIDPSAGPDRAGFGSIVIIGLLALSTITIWARGVEGQPLLAVSATLTGAVYTGATLSFIIFLRDLPEIEGVLHGTALVLAPIVLTWVSDTFAFFTGRAFGSRKLIPKVSPGKTVEGAFGAVVGTIVFSIGYATVLNRFPGYTVSMIEAVIFGAAISIAAQIGDLAESVLKRDAGVKDSGTLLPGHGGALDRFDSLFFTFPLGYLFFRFVVGSPQPF